MPLFTSGPLCSKKALCSNLEMARADEFLSFVEKRVRFWDEAGVEVVMHGLRGGGIHEVVDS